MGATDDIIEDDKQQQILLVGIQSDGTPTKVLCDATGKLQITGSGDITSVVAGTGLTGGAVTGAATVNVIGGDGITVNADEIEVSVDDSTIELSASSGAGVVRVKDNGITLAKMASGTDGNIISYDASGNPVAIATGNDGQVLTSTGAGSPPAFEAIAASAITATANGANNRIGTYSDATSLNGEANLTFDGTILDLTGNLQMAEVSTPSAVADHGKVYPQSTNNLFFQDGAGVEKPVMLGGTHSIWIPAEAISPRSNAGCDALTTTAAASAGQPDIRGLGFDTGSDEHAQFSVAFPRTWNKGTLTAQYCWTAIASGSGTVSWGLQGVAMANDDPLAAAFGTAVVTADTLTAVKDVHFSPVSSAITLGGSPGHDELTTFQVYRDVSADNLGVDAVLLGLKLFYTIAQGNEESGKDV